MPSMRNLIFSLFLGSLCLGCGFGGDKGKNKGKDVPVEAPVPKDQPPAQK